MTDELKKKIFEEFSKALERFAVSLKQEQHEFIKEACIQCFEFTFELAWKAVKRFAEAEGLQSVFNTPKRAFKEALALGWIADEKAWLNMIEKRNLTVHVYKEDIAQEVFDALPQFYDLFLSLHDHLRKEL